MRIAAIFILVFLAACGEEPLVERTLPPDFVRPSSAADVADDTVETVWEIEMTGTVETGFVFQPSSITIKAGDLVRWVNSSGFPHNVAFDTDSIPLGAAQVVDGLIPIEGKMGPLIGPIIRNRGATFEIRFVNAPPGVYKYFSVIQDTDMTGTIVVEW